MVNLNNMTAKEARIKSLDVHYILLDIFNKIEKETNKGSFNLDVKEHLPQNIVEALKERGYTIWINPSEDKCIISWI